MTERWIEEVGQDRPFDRPALLEPREGDGDVVEIEREVAEGVAIHVNEERVTGLRGRHAFGPHQHAGAVDRDVALRTAQDVEDGERLGRNDPVDLESFAGHDVLLVTWVSHHRRLVPPA